MPNSREYKHLQYGIEVKNILINRIEHIEGLELKRTISTFFKKWAKCTF